MFWYGPRSSLTQLTERIRGPATAGPIGATVRCIGIVVFTLGGEGLVINMLGWALTFRSGVGMVIVLLALLVLLVRMSSEECLLRERFGAEHDAYCARTARG